jgi:hypothetical protein
MVSAKTAFKPKDISYNIPIHANFLTKACSFVWQSAAKEMFRYEVSPKVTISQDDGRCVKCITLFYSMPVPVRLFSDTVVSHGRTTKFDAENFT